MKKYWQIFKINFLTFLEYRTDLLISFVIKLSIFVAFVMVWARIDEEGKAISGYGFTGIVFYYLAAQILDGIRTSQTARDLRKDIVSGQLSAKLVKPFNQTGYFLAKHLARVLSETILNVSLSVPIFLIWGRLLSFIDLTFEMIFQIIIILILAVVFDFLLFLAVGYVAFWTKEAHGLQAVVKNSSKFFAGELIPLDLLPATLVRWLNFFPFPYTLFFPIKVIMGSVTFNEFVKSIFIFSIWIFAFYLLNVFLWKRGLKQYEAVGI
jgi:ABC-2 type transport system permease protein